MKLLIIQQKMIGDVLTCSILCEQVKKQHPNYQVHFLVNSNTLPVTTNNPYIDKLVIFKPEYRASKLKFFKFLLAIRNEKYDVVIDAYGKLESNLITLFSGAHKKVSYAKYYSKYFYTHPIIPTNFKTDNKGFAISRRLQLLEAIGISTQKASLPKLYVSEEENNEAIQLLTKDGLDLNLPTIMISITGSSSNKTYPLSYMAKVVDLVAETTNANLLFNYIPNQLALAQEVYDACSNKTKSNIYFDTLGKNLRSFIGIMNQCQCIIGNDGGAINMAKALNKPSFIIFSPWIEKKVWATFEDNLYHKSVHLKDYEPGLFLNKSEGFLKKNSIKLYQHFKPEFFKSELSDYLKTLTQQNLDTYALEHSLKTESTASISALVITHNEEQNIVPLLNNLDFADEILIVDSYSTDKTVEEIQKYPHVKLIQREFINFSNQRNFALSQATHDWVLFIDADERITPNLKQEILTQINKKDNPVVAYEMYRKFFYKKQLVRFSGWQTDKVFRLYKKQQVAYKKDLMVHELLDINGSTAILQHKLDHYSYESYTDYKGKMEHYAFLRAKELFVKNLKPNGYHFFIKPLYRFINHYIMRLGILDGKKGITISYLSAYYVYKRYVALKKLYKKA